MKSEQEIKDALARILADERIDYPPADVNVNAPLALIQVELEAKRDTLAWVLGIKNKKEVNSDG